LLISDDVGIGKTIEAGLVSDELIDRGKLIDCGALPAATGRTVAVRSCVPNYHIEANWYCKHSRRWNGSWAVAISVRPPSVRHRFHGFHQGVGRRRDEFLRTCPKLVIVDERIPAPRTGTARPAPTLPAHQGLAADPEPIYPVTATPHAGTSCFRSLLTSWMRLSSISRRSERGANEAHRKRLAAHFIQRRRADIAIIWMRIRLSLSARRREYL